MKGEKREPLRIGDPVTLYWAQQEAFTYTLVVNVSSVGFQGATPRDSHRHFNNEGVTWVRGHHPPDSEPCRAMISAAVLIGGDEPTPDVPSAAAVTRAFYATRFFAVTGGEKLRFATHNHGIEI